MALLPWLKRWEEWKDSKAMAQLRQAVQALQASGLQIARLYTLRFIYVDNGKEVCTVDVNKHIIISMIWRNYSEDNWPKYTPAPLQAELMQKQVEFEKHLNEGGYPPALTDEELHIIREFTKYKKF